MTLTRQQLIDLIHSPVYLGDGLYASYDGYGITLTAPRENGDHFVALEPDVLRNFDEYRATIKARMDKLRGLKNE